MTRFFVSPGEVQSDRILLTGENAAHGRVLRLKAGERILVCDGNGKEYLCQIDSVDSVQIQASVLEAKCSSSEPDAFVSIYMAFPKADKLEHVIQKATELGAGEIVAFPSERCVSKPDEKS